VIEVSQQDDVAVLTLVHGKANALDLELCEALTHRFLELQRQSARAAIVTGRGSIFSAGVDLVQLSEGGADYVRRFLPALHKLYDTIFHFPKPVIAAVNGHAVAGGCVLACCADWRLMARDGGRIGITELLVGVPFPALAFEIMRAAAGGRTFADTVLSGATFLPEVALERGLIDEIVEGEELQRRAMALAQRLTALSPEAFALTKRQLRQPADERMARDGAHIEAEASAIWTRPETLARVRDYVARTLKKS
jgi:enoyl-CoA hydratase